MYVRVRSFNIHQSQAAW